MIPMNTRTDGNEPTEPSVEAKELILGVAFAMVLMWFAVHTHGWIRGTFDVIMAVVLVVLFRIMYRDYLDKGWHIPRLYEVIGYGFILVTAGLVGLTMPYAGGVYDPINMWLYERYGLVDLPNMLLGMLIVLIPGIIGMFILWLGNSRSKPGIDDEWE
jgi:hypothetical protein